jgi:hypothetical protein
MSIIQDALRKAQARIEARKSIGQTQNIPKPEGDPAARTVIREAAPLLKIEKHPFDTRTAAIIIFCLGLACAGIISLRLLPRQGAKTQPETGTGPEITGSPKDTQTLQEVVYKPPAPKPEPQGSKETAAAPSPAPVSAPPKALRRATEAQYPQFALNGIMYLNDRPQAIINGFTLEEGDTISGATVVRIEKNSVILHMNDVEIMLTLKR